MSRFFGKSGRRRMPKSYTSKAGRSVVTLLLGVVMIVASATIASAADFKSISADPLTPATCNSNTWDITISQIDTETDVPHSIHVNWANQTIDDLTPTFTGGTAHYMYSGNLDSTVTSATTDIYGAWAGEFRVSEGPCSTPPPVDACPNIAGNQSEVPSGMVKNDAGDCVTPPPPPKTCPDGSAPPCQVVIVDPGPPHHGHHSGGHSGTGHHAVGGGRVPSSLPHAGWTAGAQSSLARLLLAGGTLLLAGGTGSVAAAIRRRNKGVR